MAETKQSVKSKVDDAIAENLNNKAPYKTIINSIKTSNRKGKSLYNYVNMTVRSRRNGNKKFWNSDFLYPSHPRNVFTEEFDGGLNSGFFETSHKSLYPWMLTKPQNIGKSDPVAHILEKTHEWAHKWTLFKKSSGKYKSFRSTPIYKWLSDDVLYCPKSFIDMAAHLMNKPDPYFNEVFNWYYSGKGNMSIVNLDGWDYIICSDFNCLKVSPFFKDNFSIDDNNTASYKCSEDTNILETVHSQNIIAIRTKCKIIILKISRMDNMMLELLTEINSELPYTSVAFDEFHKNILYITTLDYKLTIVNIDRLTKRSIKLRGKFTTLEDNWNSVIGSERGSFLHITKTALTLYDKRTNAPYQRYKSIVSVSDVQKCALISAARYCTGKPLLYVGTTHELFLMDMRCGNTKEDNMKPVQRWTHGMMSPPVYMDICSYGENNKEAICLSSQWFEDMCITTNYGDRLSRAGEIPGLCVPYRPPSIMQTYTEARRRRLCCTLNRPIKRRLLTFITGVALVPRDDTYSVLMQNSLGDISCHSLYPDTRLPHLQDDAVERLHEWSARFEGETQPIFQVTKIVDVAPLLRNLRRVPDDFILGRNPVISQRFKFNEDEIYETYQQEKLDPEFLEVWKDEDEEITLNDTGSRFFVDTS